MTDGYPGIKILVNIIRYVCFILIKHTNNSMLKRGGASDAQRAGEGNIVGEKRDESIPRLLSRLYILRFAQPLLPHGA